MQGGDVACEITGGAQRWLPAALLPGQRCHRLLNQGGFPLCGGLDDPQVTRLYAVLTQPHR